MVVLVVQVRAHQVTLIAERVVEAGRVAILEVALGRVRDHDTLVRVLVRLVRQERCARLMSVDVAGPLSANSVRQPAQSRERRPEETGELVATPDAIVLLDQNARLDGSRRVDEAAGRVVAAGGQRVLAVLAASAASLAVEAGAGHQLRRGVELRLLLVWLVGAREVVLGARDQTVLQLHGIPRVGGRAGAEESRDWLLCFVACLLVAAPGEQRVHRREAAQR